MKKRCISRLLCLMLLLTLLPAQAFARLPQNINLRVHYDTNGGSVFASQGAQAPQATAEDYLFEGRDCAVTEGETLQFRFDEQKAIDWERYDQTGNVEFRDAWESDDRALTVVARYDTPEGWFDGPVILHGAAAKNGFTFADGVLSFAAPSSDIELAVFWTREDYDFDLFRGTQDAPIIVEANWWGRGEIDLPAGISAENAKVGDGRMRVRVADTLPSVTFTWKDGYDIRRINVDGAGPNGDRLEIENPEGNSYTLTLDQKRDGNEPQDFYHAEFEFEGGGAPENGAVRVNYDMNRLAAFGTVGGGEEAFVRSDNETSFLADGEPAEISLRLDNTKCIDWEKLEHDEIVLQPVENPETPDYYIEACFEEANGAWFEGLVVAHGAAVKDGFTFQNNVLRFTPVSRGNVEIRVFLSERDYQFGTFRGTEEKPIVVEYRWWGAGEVTTALPVPPEDMLAADGQVKIRVAAGTAGVIFTWGADSTLRRIGVDGAGPNGDRLEIENPEGNSYALPLNQTWDNGDPRDSYSIEFEFEGGGDRPGELHVIYDNNGGSVFAGFGGTAVTGTADEYQSGQWDDTFYFLKDNVPQAVELLIDSYHKVDFDKWDQSQEFSLVQSDYRDDRSLYVTLRGKQANGEWFDGLIVEDGVAVQPGVSFENGRLLITPYGKNEMELHVYWTREDFEFDLFRGTEDAPVIVEINWWGKGEPVLPDDIAPENIKRSDDRLRVRLPEDRDTLKVAWTDGATLRRIVVDGAGPEGDRLEIEEPDFDSYTLTLDQVRDDGEPEDFYHLEMGFEDNGELSPFEARLDYECTEGSLYFNLGEGAPVLDKSTYANGRKSKSYKDNGGIARINITLDPTKAVDFRKERVGEFDLSDLATPVEPYAPCIFVRYPLDNEEWFEEFVVWEGKAEIDGFTFENNTLSFTPVNENGVQVIVFWNRANFEVRVFEGTDEKPVIIDALFVDSVPVTLPAGIPEEDTVVYKGAASTLVKFRVPRGQQQLVFSWADEYKLERIERNIPGVGYDVIAAAEGGSYTLVTQDDADYYMLDFWFEQDNCPDTAALEAAIALAEAVKRADFTDLSLKPMDEALTAAKATLADKDAAQEDVDAAAAALNAAVRALVRKSTVKVSSFTDVRKKDWYYSSVKWAVENNITSGVSDGKFAPNKTCTRAEVVTFLWNAAGKPAPKSAKNPFVDVKKSDWYYKAVLWAVESGITKGVDATHFAPTKTCTRAEVVVFLRAGSGNPEPKTSKNPFVDIKKKDWFYKAVLWAVENNITKGVDTTHFAPDKTCTRCEIVTFMYQDFING